MELKEFSDWPGDDTKPLPLDVAIVLTWARISSRATSIIGNLHAGDLHMKAKRNFQDSEINDPKVENYLAKFRSRFDL